MLLCCIIVHVGNEVCTYSSHFLKLYRGIVETPQILRTFFTSEGFQLNSTRSTHIIVVHTLFCCSMYTVHNGVNLFSVRWQTWLTRRSVMCQCSVETTPLTWEPCSRYVHICIPFLQVNMLISTSAHTHIHVHMYVLYVCTFTHACAHTHLCRSMKTQVPRGQSEERFWTEPSQPMNQPQQIQSVTLYIQNH